MVVHELKSYAEFKSKVLEGEGLKFVDFYATWCGPCKAIAPKIEQYSNEYADVEFYKLDVDEVGDAAQECGITAMPTFHYFKNGESVHSVRGANPPAIQAGIEQNK